MCSTKYAVTAITPAMVVGCIFRSFSVAFSSISAHFSCASSRGQRSGVPSFMDPILEMMGSIKDGTPERWPLEDAHEKWADIEEKATLKLRKIQPTTIAGVMAVTAYFVEHIDRYPDC